MDNLISRFRVTVHGERAAPHILAAFFIGPSFGRAF
jgi:hypothetical protein